MAKGSARILGRSPTGSRRWAYAQAGALALLLAVFGVATAQVHATEADLTRTSFTIPGPIPVPVLRFAPHSGDGLAPPNTVAIVAHGFSASKEIMTTFCSALARAGIIAYCFDFPGHGESTVPFADAGETPTSPAVQRRLMDTVGEVVDYATAQGRSAPGVILIGHSMGTSAVGGYALAHAGDPRLLATVLVSPVFSGTPTTDAPSNLLTIAGANDIPVAIADAQRLVAAGCGLDTNKPLPSGYRCDGSSAGGGREVVLLPALNHISILTASTAVAATLDWLRARLGRGIATTPVGADDRLHWFLLGLLAASLALLPLLALGSAVLRLTPAGTEAAAGAGASPASLHLGRRALIELGVFVGATGAALLVLHAWAPTPLGFVRQLIGPDVATFFFVAGVVEIAVHLAVPALRPAFVWPAGARIAGQLLLALLAALFLYLTLGTLSTFAWASLALPPQRLWRAAVLALFVFPFLLGAETAAGSLARRPWLAALARLVMAVLVTVALVVAIAWDPDRLGFLGILLPLLVVLLLGFVGLEAWVRRVVATPTLTIALAEALLLGWALAATFPLL